MGALIFLLLVTTRRMRQDQQSAINTSAAAEPALNELITENKPDEFVSSPEESRQSDNPGQNQDFSISLMPPATVAELGASQDSRSLADLASMRQQIDGLQQQIEAERESYDHLVSGIVDAKQKLRNNDNGSSSYQSQLQELAHLRQQETELRQRLNQKHVTVARLQIELEASSQSTADGESLLKARESALVSLRNIVRESSEQTAAGTDQTVVEFTNSTGTQRSPIIVNVTESGFEFLPCGIRITSSDMQGFPGNDNPLLAGVLAVHEHRHPNSGSVKPYVLLVVRPDGSMPFYGAQRTLTDAGIHFGYELLAQEQTLAAGRRDPAETNTLRKSVLAALNRRETLYSGMLAQVQQLREKYEAQQGSVPDERTIQVLPNGRLVMAEDHPTGSDSGFREQHDGRFYAGGHAPPLKTMSRNSPFSAGKQNDDRPGQQSANPFSVFAKNESDKTTATQNNTTPAVVSPFDFPNTPAGKAFNNPGQPTGDGMDADRSTSPVVAPHRFNDSKPTAVADVFPEFPNVNDAAEPGLDAIDVRQALPRAMPLSGNLGTGSDRSFALSEGRANTTDHDTTARHQLSNTAQNRDNPRAPTGWPDSVTANHELATRTAGPAQGSSNATFGEPGMQSGELRAGSPAISGSSAFGSAENGESSVGGTGMAVASDRQSYLEKFMQMVEDEKSEKTPDSMLVSLLNKGRETAKLRATQPPESQQRAPVPRTQSPLAEAFGTIAGDTNVSDAKIAATKAALDSSNSSPSTQEESALSEPVQNTADTAGPPRNGSPEAENSITPTDADPEPQFQLFTDDDSVKSTVAVKSAPSHAAESTPSSERNASPSAKTLNQQRTYFVVKIFVGANRLSIGDFEEIDTTDWGADERLAMTLEAVSATMDDVWANVRKDALPAVRFLVAPGAAKIQQKLSKQLADMNVPTRSVQELGPNMTIDQFFSASPTANSPGASAAPSTAPAEPAPARAPDRRRNSI